MACLVAIFRKQWVENERLSFPLVQLPMEMCAGGMTARERDRRVMWAGALIPFLFHGMNGLANIFPAVPSVNTWSSLNGYFITPPWNHMGALPLTINFTIVGLTYLLPLDVGFSMWFFPLFMRVQNTIAGSYGYEFKAMPTMLVANECIAYQSMGAAVAVCASLIWFAKPHLRAVWQSVCHAARHKQDGEEWMSYKHALVGSAISFVLLVIWCAMAGLNVWVAAFMLLAFVLLILIMMARCVAEVGTPMLEGVFRPLDLWSVVAMKSTLGVSNLAPLAMISPIFMRHPRTLMALFMDGMKLSDGVRLRRATLGVAFAIAVPLAMLVSYYVQLKICYTHGALSLNNFLIWGVPQLHLMESSSILNGYEKFNPANAGYFTAGMLFTFFLYFMRSRYWWWPFHPLGYAAGAWWSGSIWWAMFFMGWLLKSLILRYGGMKMYGYCRPFFLGLILGEISTAVFWAIISGATGCTPPTIPFN